MFKKGASEIISYVLIIGLSIALTIAVGLWSRSESERVVKTTVEETETDARCADVYLGGSVCNENTKEVMKLINRGSFTIVSLRYICTNSQNSVIGGKIALDKSIGPGEEQSLNIIAGCDITKGGITLTPFINIEGKEVVCPEKKKVIESITGNIENC